MKSSNPIKNKFDNSEIYKLKCHTCSLKYLGQTGKDLKTQLKEHTRYIKTNNPKSAYAKHILDNRHEYSPADTTIQLIKPCAKGRIMDRWENFYIQQTLLVGYLIPEQTLHNHII
jgi:hypothetical protein